MHDAIVLKQTYWNLVDIDCGKYDIRVLVA